MKFPTIAVPPDEQKQQQKQQQNSAKLQLIIKYITFENKKIDDEPINECIVQN